MGEIIEMGKKAVGYSSYADFKEALDNVVERVEEGFVQIGYHLKVARDTNILQESGYANVNEFAEAEYGLDKTAVSRFVAIMIVLLKMDILLFFRRNTVDLDVQNFPLCLCFLKILMRSCHRSTAKQK